MSDMDINRMQQDIEQLQDQNAIDFQKLNKLGKDIEKLDEKIITINKHLDLLMKKINGEIASIEKSIQAIEDKIK